MTKPSTESGNNYQNLELADIIRKSYRVPMADIGRIRMTVNAKSFNVLDISPKGVCIAIEDERTFVADQVLSGCEMHIEDTVITKLDGKVIHISFSERHLWQCGIQWISGPSDAFRLMEEITTRMKNQLLKQDTTLHDDTIG